MPPTPDSCARSIDERESSNEWLVQDYKPIGIFVLKPLLVRQRIPGMALVSHVEVEVGFDALVGRVFPNLRIFSANERTFVEFDRAARDWRAIGIRDIYP